MTEAKTASIQSEGTQSLQDQIAALRATIESATPKDVQDLFGKLTAAIPVIDDTIYLLETHSKQTPDANDILGKLQADRQFILDTTERLNNLLNQEDSELEIRAQDLESIQTKITGAVIPDIQAALEIVASEPLSVKPEEPKYKYPFPAEK